MNGALVFTVTFSLFVFFFSSIALFVARGRRKKKIYQKTLKAPVVVTSATHATPAGGYHVSQMPPQNSGYQTNVYSAPYPTQTGAFVQMPMPMAAAQQPAQPGIVGYPPMPMPQQHMNPPSYDVAVASNAAGHINNVPYEKQSAYNPSYTAH